MEYHTSMHADEEATLARFALQGGLLLAIRCLDEGVDIPSATHAIVLASSRNPRQFVQRRGRLLRRARGKDTVFIHDPLVIPPVSADQARSDGLVWGELSRAARFSQSAANAAEAARPLDAICIDRGLDVDLLWSADNTETDND
jgi:superfamily II DNA or RNA helicase